MSCIIPYDLIQTHIEDIRARGKIRIAFTNGCFDLLHRGHVEYLQQARKMADLLVVGLNSDASVRRLKGPGRPYVSEEDRATILCGLKAVDIVCIFNDDTPAGLITRVKPDILVKGGDYQLNEIVGRRFVESYGGQVLTIPLVAGKSSTNIIERIRQSLK